MIDTGSAGDGSEALVRHRDALRACHTCSNMTGPPVAGEAVVSPVLLMGQAPGTREVRTGRPFAWTAGRTLFGWFDSIGLAEQEFRERVYMTAVCRCFPGKNPKGGDRAPSKEETENCRCWWQEELALVHPRLIVPVGGLAIAQFMESKRLADVVGKRWRHQLPGGEAADLIPLPHPSGVSTWFKNEPGKTLLAQALSLIAVHPAWRELMQRGRPS